MNYDKQYREWQDWPECILSAREINNDMEIVHFYREKNSHEGIGKFKSIKKLCANQVNQDFLIEIGELINLEHLEIEVLTSTNLNPLNQLKNLRFLKLTSVRKVTDFKPITGIDSLRKLFIESAKHIESLDFLSDAHNLSVIGIEGGMYTKQKINSLKPFSDLGALEALFLTSVQLGDKNLDSLSSIPNFKYLKCARFAPKSSFISLRQHLPQLICNWCDEYEV